MDEAEKQTLKMKLVRTPDGKMSCDLCYFNPSTCLQYVVVLCGDRHFEPSTPIKIEIVEDKP